MKVISIRELHNRTGHWVRTAEKEGPIAVTDRGRRVAFLGDLSKLEEGGRTFPRRDRSKLPPTDLDSTRLVSEDRDR